MPTIYHKEGLIDRFEEVVLPERYFYAPTTSPVSISTYASDTAPEPGCANIEMDVMYKSGNKERVIHYFPGDIIPGQVYYLPDGTQLPIVNYTPTGGSLSTSFAAGHIKQKTSNAIICKIVAKDSLPFMSGFEVGTSFVNAKSLTQNHYITFSHNTLQYLHGKPWVTIQQQG